MDDVRSHSRARWNDLVRTLVALGLDVADAEQLAVTALARTRGRWREEQRQGDVDVLVYGELVRLAGRERPVLVAGDADRVRLRRVLHEGAGLDDHQLDAVLGDAAAAGHAGGPPPWGEARWEELYAGVPRLDGAGGVDDVVRRTRRRRLVAGAGAVAVAGAVAGVLALTGRHSPAPPVPPTPDLVPAAADVVALPWWSDDVLHLGHGTVEVPGLRVLAQAGAGFAYAVVYGDDRGQVVQVAPDGTSTLVGREDVGAPVLGSPDGRAVWVEAGGTRLVVWDASAGAEAATLTLDDPAAARVVALDGGTVHLRLSSGPASWRPGQPAATPEAQVPRRADAVRGGTRAAGPQSDLSPDGRLVATWTPRRPGVRLRAVAGSGATAPRLRLPAADRVLDAHFAPDGDLVVATAHLYGLSIGSLRTPGGPGTSLFLQLLTCGAGDGRCVTSLARGAAAGDGTGPPPVVLPR